MVVDELTSTIVEKTALNSHSKHGWIDDPSKSSLWQRRSTEKNTLFVCQTRLTQTNPNREMWTAAFIPSPMTCV